MHPKRKQRLFLLLFLMIGLGATVALALVALRENLNAFYAPVQMINGEAPIDTRIRAGGMVKEGSVQRDSNSLRVSFVLSDLAGSEFTVDFDGILPDLFREGQGILATGKLGPNGRFYAEEVLAKHDENYMPPELIDMHKSEAPTS